MGRRMGTAFRRGFCAVLATVALVLAASSASAQTLAAVKARGALLCGVNEGLPGFSNLDERGQWSGFDVDFCRALAAAIFGDPNHLRLVPLTAEARFQALKDGKIDVLSRNSTWTMGREVSYGLAFVGVTYYDGQGFMTSRAMRVSSALDLDGARVCVLSGTTTIDNLADFFSANHMALQTVTVATTDELIKAYDFRRLQRGDQRPVATLCAAPAALQSARPCHSARRDLEGAARAGGAPERPELGRDRALGPFRNAQRRGTRRQPAHARSGDAVREARGHAARRHGRRFRLGPRPRRTHGPPT